MTGKDSDTTQPVTLPNKPEEDAKPPENECIDAVDSLISKVKKIMSPDDLEVSVISSEILSTIVKEKDLSNLVSQLCDVALSFSETCPVIGAIFGNISILQIGELKIRSLLLGRLQVEYKKRKELLETDRSRFVNSSTLLGEVFYYVKTDQGMQFHVLAEPVVAYLSEIVQIHLSVDPGPDINEEMIVVAKQLLMNGCALFGSVPEKVQDLFRDVSEVFIRHELNSVSKLNLLAALGELWPVLNQSLKTRTLHATLAAKMGLALKI